MIARISLQAHTQLCIHFAHVVRTRCELLLRVWTHTRTHATRNKKKGAEGPRRVMNKVSKTQSKTNGGQKDTAETEKQLYKTKDHHWRFCCIFSNHYQYTKIIPCFRGASGICLRLVLVGGAPCAIRIGEDYCRLRVQQNMHLKSAGAWHSSTITKAPGAILCAPNTFPVIVKKRNQTV